MERVLIVEDSPTQREMLQHTLENGGYHVVTAVNGKDAWQRFTQIAPTLVVTDILMPEMDGYELCRAIKQTPASARIPVVLLTSLANPKDVIMGLECGADNFIGKPFDEDHLLSRIRHVIANRDLPARDKREQGVEISHEGRTHLITAERPQIVDLLLTVYEVAVRRNEDLIRAEAKLRKLNSDLEQKVRDRTRKLEESNRSLETFCYSIAHDLRAPLRGINGFLTILAEDYAENLDETARDYAARTVAAAGRMDKMIQALLAYGRISHADAPLRQMDLRQELARVVDDFAEEIRVKQAKVRIEVTAPFVSASPVLLTQLLTNLIGNALKFVKPGQPPEITLSADAVGSGERVAIAVADQGIGIDPPYLEKIFDVFERGHNDPAYTGTGIGLAIVRKAAERMSGTVRVESPAGGGSRFVVELPAAPVGA